MIYLRRIDNHIVIASGYVQLGGLGEYNHAIYEEIEGRIPLDAEFANEDKMTGEPIINDGG